MSKQDFVAVDAGTEWTGVVVYWSLSGSVYQATLEDCCDEQGIDEDLIPKPDGITRALRNAMNRYTTKRVILRTLGRNKGFALVSEREDDDTGLKHHTDLQVKIDRPYNSSGQQIPTLRFTPDIHPYRAAIEGDTKDLMEKIDSGRFGRWLTDFIVKELQGVGLRSSGGIYFIPSEHVSAWNALRDAIRDASDHTLFEIPAARTEEAVKSVLEAIRSEAAATAAAMFTELEETEEWGSRALGTKKRMCADMANKLDTYEKLLGESLGDLREQMDEVSAALATAVLVSDVEDVG